MAAEGGPGSTRTGRAWVASAPHRRLVAWCGTHGRGGSCAAPGPHAGMRPPGRAGPGGRGEALRTALHPRAARDGAETAPLPRRRASDRPGGGGLDAHGRRTDAGAADTSPASPPPPSRRPARWRRWRRRRSTARATPAAAKAVRAARTGNPTAAARPWRWGYPSAEQRAAHSPPGAGRPLFCRGLSPGGGRRSGPRPPVRPPGAARSAGPGGRAGTCPPSRTRRRGRAPPRAGCARRPTRAGTARVR